LSYDIKWCCPLTMRLRWGNLAVKKVVVGMVALSEF